MNPTQIKKAVALTYNKADSAPRISATGNGLVAENIISKAREHGVPIHESKELVSLLINVDLDDQIPSELYRVVAELLAWIHTLEKQNTQQ